MRSPTVTHLLPVLLFLIFGVLLWRSKISLVPYVRIGMQVRDLLQGEETLLTSEYPPLASALFGLLQRQLFGLSFIGAWKALILALTAAATLFARRDAVSLLCAMILSIPLFGTEIFFARYDIFILLTLCITWIAYRRKYPLLAGLALAMAASLKVVPVVLLPFLWIPLSPPERRKLLSGFLGGVLLGFLLPSIVMGWNLTIENLEFLGSFHGARGLQIESTWSGLLLLLAAITRQTVTIDHRQGAFEFIAHPMLSLLARVLTVLGLAFLLWRTWRERRTSDPAHMSLIALPLLWAFLVSPVLSPQYFVWILPLLLAEGLERLWERPSVRACGFVLLTALTAALTHWIFPVLYYALIHLWLWPVLILNVRNLCVAGLIAMTCHLRR